MGVTAPEVVGELVYLTSPGAAAVTASADPGALTRCEAEMRGSILAMRERLDDAAKNLAQLERFPQLADRGRCARCAFRRPCGRL